MQLWIILTILAIFSRAIYGVFTKVMSHSVEETSFATNLLFLTLANTCFAFLTAPFLGNIDYSTRVFSWSFLIMIISSLIGNLLYFAAIKKLSSSNAQIIFSSILPFNTLLGVFVLSQSITVLNIVGILLMMVSIFIACYVKEKIDFKSLILMILSAASFAFMQIYTAVVSKSISVGSYFFYSSAIITIATFIIYRKKILADMPSLNFSYGKAIVITSFFSSLNVLFSFFAYKNSPEPTKVAMLFTGQVIVAVIISAIFLGDRANIGRKLLAATLAVIAALLIKI